MLDGHRKRRRLALAETLLFAVVLMMVPLGHHDLACHLKSTQHCTSCALSPLGSHSHWHPTPGADSLADAGGALAYRARPDGTTLVVRTTGRSPPTFA